MIYTEFHKQHNILNTVQNRNQFSYHLLSSTALSFQCKLFNRREMMIWKWYIWKCRNKQAFWYKWGDEQQFSCW